MVDTGVRSLAVLGCRSLNAQPQPLLRTDVLKLRRDDWEKKPRMWLQCLEGASERH